MDHVVEDARAHATALVKADVQDVTVHVKVGAMVLAKETATEFQVNIYC